MVSNNCEEFFRHDGQREDSAMNEGKAGEEYRLSRGYSAYVLALLFLLYMFDYIDRMVVVSLFPFLKMDWGLSDTQCGMLVSAVYWSVVLFSLPASIIVDRWSRAKSIGLMAVFWSLATAACALTRNFSQLFAARAAIGVGEAGYAPGGAVLLYAIYPDEKRSRVLGVWNAAIPMGIAIGIAAGGLIAEKLGWRHAFGIVALPGLLVAFLSLKIRDYRTVPLSRDKNRAGIRPAVLSFIKGLAGTRTLIFLYLGFACNVFVTTSFSTWLPTYFERVEGVPVGQAGMKTAVILLMAIVGAPLGGYLADLWMRTNRNARMHFIALSSLLTAILLAAALLLFSGGARFALFLGVGAASVGFVPAAMAVIQDVVHPGLRATYFSFNVIIQNILGSSLGPIAVGYLSDLYGIQTALAAVPLFSGIAAALFFAGSFHYGADTAKVEKAPLVGET